MTTQHDKAVIILASIMVLLETFDTSFACADAALADSVLEDLHENRKHNQD